MAFNKQPKTRLISGGNRRSGAGPEKAPSGRNHASKSFPAQRLLRAARAARRLASAPYSRFRVGAALLTADGAVITGANVESVSYGLTCCAERVALFKALTEGHSDFVGLAVVARVTGGAMPCGACRQLLAEYAAGATILVADSDALANYRMFSVPELLPGAFLSGLPAASHPGF